MEKLQAIVEYDIINEMVHVSLNNHAVRIAVTRPHIAQIDLDDHGNLVGIELEGVRIDMGGKPEDPAKHPLTQEEMQEAARKRSSNYDQLTAEEQWLEDKQLGILDWEGGPYKPEP